LRLLGGPPREHRAVPRPPRPLVEIREVAREPHDGAELTERLHASFATREAAARRDHVARLQPERFERLGLELAEALLPLRTEDVGDRAPLPGDDHVVGLHEAAAEPPREESPDRRFPRSHEADENDVVRAHLPHRIRSLRRGRRAGGQALDRDGASRAEAGWSPAAERHTSACRVAESPRGPRWPPPRFARPALHGP